MTLRVENHWLVSDSPKFQLTKKEEVVGPIITPEVILVHYGVSNTLASLTAAQRATGYRAQLTIDGWGGTAHGAVYQVYQSMRLDMRASHAGKSAYKGRPSVNGFSIGIEIANPGPLIRCKDGKLRTDANAQAFGRGNANAPVWPEDQAVKAIHKNGRIRLPYGEWDHWATYTDQEMDILIAIGLAAREAYPSLIDIVGHDDVALPKGRKSDPGPAMDIEYLRKKIFG